MRTTPCCFCVSQKPYFQVCGPAPGSRDWAHRRNLFKKKNSFFLPGIGTLKWCVQCLTLQMIFLYLTRLLPLNEALQLIKFSENSTLCRKSEGNHLEWGQLSAWGRPQLSLGRSHRISAVGKQPLPASHGAVPRASRRRQQLSSDGLQGVSIAKRTP